MTAETRAGRHTRRGFWPEWAGYATAVWSGAYGLLGLYWALGGGAFPFGEEHSILERVEPAGTGR